MKRLCSALIFTLVSNSVIAFDCRNFDNQKKKLISESPYFVDDIRCLNGTLDWEISNRRVIVRGEVLPVVKPKFRPLEKVATKPQLPKRAAPQISNKKNEPSRGISFIPGLNEWNTSVSYGAKYLSLSQKGSLIEDADVDVTFLNNIKIHSEFIFEDWSGWFHSETYRFKYSTLTKGDSKTMTSLEFGASYKWLLATLGSDENPLFRNNGGEVELAAMNIVYLGVGVKKDFEIPSLGPTFLRLKGLARYPLMTGTSDTSIKTSALSGYSLVTRAELSRQIYNKVNYSVLLTFMGGVDYQNLSQDVTWDNQKGSADSSIISASAGLGLLFCLK